MVPAALPAVDPVLAERARQDLANAQAFTAVFKAHAGVHPALREAACQEVQYPHLLEQIGPRDLIAGRYRPGDRVLVAFSPQMWTADRNNQAGYCLNSAAVARAGAQAGGEWGGVAAELEAYWCAACTWEQARRLNLSDIGAAPATGNRPGAGGMVGGGGIRMAGIMLDFDGLIRQGIPGLQARVAASGDGPVQQAMQRTLSLVVRMALHYRDQAVAQAAQAEGRRRQELAAMADALDAITQRAPGSLREAVQLFWLWVCLSGVVNFARMDVYLGDWYAHDLDDGTLDQAGADALLDSLWRLIEDLRRPFDSRVVVGGVGRRNPANADRFALAAIAATHRARTVAPTLTLRLHPGQDPALLGRGLDAIGDGCLYPMLYNDEANVPAVARHFGVPQAEAEGYLPLGCGEYILDRCSINSPNTVLNLAKCVEAALHDGCCAVSGARLGPATGSPDRLRTWAELEAAVMTQVRHAAVVATSYHVNEYAVYRQEASFLLLSLLTDDCIANASGLVDGVRHCGGCVEGFGFTNAGDALVAIRETVYRSGRLDLPRLVAALDADFQGYAVERKLLRACPKFGNDDAEADALVVDLARQVCDVVMAAGREAGLSYLITSNLNPGGYDMGRSTAAGADGRRCAAPFAIGNAPTAGNDVSGLTAMLRSVAQTDPANGGFVTNVKIAREFFTSSRPQLEAILDAHFAGGGQQLNITVVAQGDLEAALADPQRFPHLIVRIGGYSARYVDLDPAVQREILARTMHGG